jgi:broad specificity phosphatase PhoE
VLKSHKLISSLALRNSYFGLRHGESLANIAGVISSSYRVGTSSHGLTEKGRQQSRDAAKHLINIISSTSLEHSDSKALREIFDNLVFVTSPFKRAHETAKECISALQSQLKVKQSFSSFRNDVKLTLYDDLRERWFGDLDAKHLLYYNRVWPVDMVSDR